MIKHFSSNDLDNKFIFFRFFPNFFTIFPNIFTTKFVPKFPKKSFK